MPAYFHRAGRQGQFPARQLVDRSYICLRTTLRARRGSDELAASRMIITPVAAGRRASEMDPSLSDPAARAWINLLVRTMPLDPSPPVPGGRPSSVDRMTKNERTLCFDLGRAERIRPRPPVGSCRAVVCARETIRTIIFSRWPRQAYISMHLPSYS